MGEFGILPCIKCGKTPVISKDISKKNEKRYAIQHCEYAVNGITETQCIVNWNKLYIKEEREVLDESTD